MLLSRRAVSVALVVCGVVASGMWFALRADADPPIDGSGDGTGPHAPLQREALVPKRLSGSTPEGSDCGAEAVSEADVTALLAECHVELDSAFCYPGAPDRLQPRDFVPAEPCDENGAPTKPDSCGALLDRAGCDGRHPLAMSAAARKRHIEDVEAVLEDLAQDCEVFAELNYFLDCERVPCVLGLVLEELDELDVSVPDAVCVAPFIDDVQMLTQYGSATLIPMVRLPEDRSDTELGARWAATKATRWAELSTFPGFDAVTGEGPREP